MNRENLKYLFWCLCGTLWATICFVVPDFLDNPVGNWQTLLLVVAYIVSVGIFQFFIISLIGANKHVCAALLPVYALTGSICAYYRFFYHVSITPLLLDAALHTHIREAAGVVSVWLVVWMVMNVLIAVMLCVVRFRKIHPNIRIGYWLLVMVIMVAYYFSIPRLKEALANRFPLHLVYSITEYISAQNRPVADRSCPAVLSEEVPDSIIVVTILGEATRADHLQLNGYNRATNPGLIQNSNVVSYPYIYSQHTNTNGSIPHILTRADSVHSEYAYTETSFVSLFRNAGFYSVWLTNKNQNKPFVDFMREADTVRYTQAAVTQSLYAKWLDNDLLPLMDEHIGHEPRQLFVLHTMGSHWLYDTHVSEELCVFQPTVTNRDIRQNTIEQITNSYDNTVVYLDAFIDSLIYRLNSYPAILLYLSDHGESLGEGGRYLHSQPEAEEEKNPAAIVWYSDAYRELFPAKVRALHANSHRHYRTDYFFYSVLSSAGIEVEGNNRLMDIFKDDAE